MALSSVCGGTGGEATEGRECSLPLALTGRTLARTRSTTQSYSATWVAVARCCVLEFEALIAGAAGTEDQFLYQVGMLSCRPW